MKENTSTFLSSFFENLRLAKIYYCVLRNYSHLPESTNGSDLDILINKKDSEIFLNLLTEIAQEYEGKIVSIIDSNICPRICVLGNKDVPWGVMFDLHYDFVSYRGHTLLSNSIVRKNTFLYNGSVSALNSNADSLNGLLKELINNGTCDERYFDAFKSSDVNEDFLNEVFNDISKPELVSALLHFKDDIFSKRALSHLVRILNVHFPKEKRFSVKTYIKLTRFFKHPGFTVVFLGTDGSGKTTIIEKIRPALSDAFHRAVYYEHLRPNRLPSIARLLGRKELLHAPVSDPHGSSQSGFVVSLLRWFYYTLDYTFGFYLKVWPRKAVRCCVWIFDRYYYDYLVDPKRSRIKLPRWILRAGQFIIPDPDLIICLGTKAEFIHKRKPETTLKEVERQVLELKSFCNAHKKAVWIDTGEDIKVSVDNALEAIIENMSHRFK